jgi:adenylate cyclase
MAKLILVSSEPNQEFELGAINTIGRHPNNSIQVLDRIISKEHAQVFKAPDGNYVLRDLGSLNGTYMNGVRIMERVLQEGDEFTLGSTRMVFTRQEEVADKSEERVTISPEMLESHIRQKIDVLSSREFLPEKDIYDVNILRRDYEKLRVAHEVGTALSLEVKLDNLLDRIMDKAFELLPADRGVIMLMNPESQELESQVVKRRDQTKNPDEEIVLSRTIVNQVVQTKNAVLSSDAAIDSRFSGAHSIIMQGIRSTMSVPLLFRDELLGLMYLDSQIATNAFTEKDLQIFTGIANQAAASIKNARLAQNIEDEAATRARFERLLSPNLVDQVVAGKLQMERGGELRRVTVLFSDIRGFTSMSEKMEAPEVVSMLNEYFEEMVDVLFRHEGTLDKYVGDEIMALFGAPILRPEDPANAVNCAVEMQKRLREFNRLREVRQEPPIQIGIGINTGEAVFGALGSSKTMQYTVVGDTVNVASRLCSLAQAGEIIVSEDTYHALGDKFETVELPRARVKGKSGELRVWNVVGHASAQPELTKPVQAATPPEGQGAAPASGTPPEGQGTPAPGTPPEGQGAPAPGTPPPASAPPPAAPPPGEPPQGGESGS